ncbi:M20/M25/M40 family metallo-hydrolase [Microbulbifer magnicolonia]|uniref:M20/M25/M40 family metallo-hydrolase n=1 Tax=Microbulbifer magnicolonia TaxID=3109744 RepID=UPI002B40E378|nr:M20/M25/M40 family metallo-hydrolase [Microbulbifer sp. GG15]
MKKLSLVLSAFLALPGALMAADSGPYEQQARKLLEDAIAMRTVQGYGQVPVYARYLAEQFRAGGFAEEDIKLIPHGEMAALIVRLRGDGSSGKKPILLSAHMDVVEARPEDWERDPFKLTEENGYFYGRGISDNKFGVTTLTTTLLRLKAEGFVPSRDIVLALSGDEETQMVTTKLLSTKYLADIDADFALVADGGGGLLGEDGQPVSFIVDSAEKTYATFEVTARNPGGHSSLPRKDNAIYDLTRALENIAGYEFPVQHSELTREFFKRSASMVGGETGRAMTAFAKNPRNKKALAVLRAQPEYVGSTGTTCVATMLRGGHAENALPQSATATINCRIFPGNSVEETLATLQEVAANPGLEWKVLDEPLASDASPIRADVFAAIERAVHAEYSGLPIIPHMASGASDALHFRAAGIPSYTFTGIFMKASDEYAHGLNERVPVATLPVALRFWHQLLTDLAGPATES